VKSVDEVAVIIQARLCSERVPRKMLREFCGSSLFEIGIKKILASSVIPKENFFVSVYENELKEVAVKHGVNIFERSEESATNDNSLQTIYEWHNKLPDKFKYVVLVSACNPLLKTASIDGFFQAYLDQEERGLMAVIDKRNYFWNDKGSMVTPWPEGQTIMNTKAVAPTYEAAHTMYGSRLDIIKDNIWMGSFKNSDPALYIVPELESFDIDYEWQFTLGEILYWKTIEGTNEKSEDC
jgi:CMP-N-acetylneuraminic acid synthetase